MKVILASGSPRRKELLLELGWEPHVIQSGFNEVKTEEDCRDIADPLLSGITGADLVPAVNALGKARDAASRFHGNRWIIGADTVVICQNQILGKPKDREDAKSMLRLLSGRVHEVKTGVAIIDGSAAEVQVETTKVWFNPMSEQEIDAYAATGECDDKAGAYAIQGKGAVFISRIEGSYDNVVGLPRALLYEMMKKKGVFTNSSCF